MGLPRQRVREAVAVQRRGEDADRMVERPAEERRVARAAAAREVVPVPQRRLPGEGGDRLGRIADAVVDAHDVAGRQALELTGRAGDDLDVGGRCRAELGLGQLGAAGRLVRVGEPRDLHAATCSNARAHWGATAAIE